MDKLVKNFNKTKVYLLGKNNIGMNIWVEPTSGKLFSSTVNNDCFYPYFNFNDLFLKERLDRISGIKAFSRFFPEMSVENQEREKLYLLLEVMIKLKNMTENFKSDQAKLVKQITEKALPETLRKINQLLSPIEV